MTYDAIIVGAGPGGATAAAFMAEDGLRVLLIDKDRFPRDKVCGDAISGKSVEVLRQLGVETCLRQNGSQGTDHGTAAPVLMLSIRPSDRSGSCRARPSPRRYLGSCTRDR